MQRGGPLILLDSDSDATLDRHDLNPTLALIGKKKALFPDYEGYECQETSAFFYF